MTNPEDAKPRMAARGLGILFLALIFFFGSRIAYAVDVPALTQNLEKTLPAPDDILYGDWVEQFRKACLLLREMKAGLGQLDMAVAAGFNGHRSEGESLYKLDLESSINKSIYPRAFRFRAGTSVLYKNNTIQEDVTSLLLNFDYYFAPSLETYAFLERFSDTYMSIKERYEIGGGVKLEGNFLGTTVREDGQDILRLVNAAAASAIQAYAEYLDRLEAEGTGKADTNVWRAWLAELENEKNNILSGLRQKYSRLSLGLAVSFFSEMERAEVETTATGPGGMESLKLPLDSQQRFRIVLRPSLSFRPLDLLTFKGHVYWKLPLGSPQRSGGHLDYRLDALFSAELTLAGDPDWGKNVSILMEFQRHYDNLPPGLSQSAIEEYLELDKVLSRTAAKQTHDIYAFKLKVEF